jgi:hypothetical protein
LLRAEAFRCVQDIDWDSLQIEARWQEEEQVICCEERLYEKLGLKDEDEKATKEREACDRRGHVVVLDENGNEAVCAGKVADIDAFCDRTNPIMCVGTRYKNMHSFWLAMREYAIRHEFELGIDASSPIKYRGYCKGGGCPWRINARPEMHGEPIIIVCILSFLWFTKIFVLVLLVSK